MPTSRKNPKPLGLLIYVVVHSLVETNWEDDHCSLVVGGVEIAGSNSRYKNYSGSEVPTDQSMNDAPDFLRSDDACLKDGSISSGNCPS
jgi:hypothetical protein